MSFLTARLDHIYCSITVAIDPERSAAHGGGGRLGWSGEGDRLLQKKILQKEGDRSKGMYGCQIGHSTYPNFSGRVIRVIQNSGNRKCYPILTLKNHYPTIRVPAILGSGSGAPDIPEVLRFATARRRCSFSPPDRCAAAGGEGGAAALATRDRRGREVEREREGSPPPADHWALPHPSPSGSPSREARGHLPPRRRCRPAS